MLRRLTRRGLPAILRQSKWNKSPAQSAPHPPRVARRQLRSASARPPWRVLPRDVFHRARFRFSFQTGLARHNVFVVIVTAPDPPAPAALPSSNVKPRTPLNRFHPQQICLCRRAIVLPQTALPIPPASNQRPLRL